MSKKLRVLQVLLDSRIGGPQRRALLLAWELRKHGILTKLCVPEEKGELSASARAGGIETFEILPHLPRRPVTASGAASCARWLATIPSGVRKICNLVRREDIDVVHVNGYLGWHAALAMRRMRVPLVFHVMGTLYPRWLVRGTLPVWAAPAAAIVSTARGTREYYLGSRMGSKSVIMYDPVDTRQFDPMRYSYSERIEARSQLGVRQGTRAVISVGNINPAKGYEHLIEAARDVLVRYPLSARFIIVGSPLQSQVRYMQKLRWMTRKLGVQDSVSFVGFTPEVGPLLAGADYFVLPSITEGTPIAILEAMAMKLPVIASNVGSISELLGDSERGMLVPPGRPKELGEAIATLMLDEAQGREMAERAREWVLTRCSIELYADRLAQLYRSVISTIQSASDAR